MSSNPYDDQTQVPPPPPGALPPERKKGLSGCAIAGIGCAVLLVVMLIIAALIGWWIYSNARTLGGGAMEQSLTQLVNQSSLSPDEKQQRLDEIEQMTEDYQQERIGHEAYFEWAGQLQMQLAPQPQTQPQPAPAPTQPAPSSPTTAPPQP